MYTGKRHRVRCTTSSERMSTSREREDVEHKEDTLYRGEGNADEIQRDPPPTKPRIRWTEIN